LTDKTKETTQESRQLYNSTILNTTRLIKSLLTTLSQETKYSTNFEQPAKQCCKGYFNFLFVNYYWDRINQRRKTKTTMRVKTLKIRI